MCDELLWIGGDKMSIEINKDFVAELSEAALRALVKTGDALRT